MRARRLLALVTVVLGAATCSLAFSASAPALLVHKYLYSFGSFGEMRGLAVNESTGDIYVYDAIEGHIYKFNSLGEPSNFSAIGANAIEDIPSNGGINRGGGYQLAVDNSSSVAKGDIYVATGTGIEIYDASGARLGELNEQVTSEVAGAPWEENACGVSVDTKGNVYIGQFYSHINKYSPTGNPVRNTDFASSLYAPLFICNVAADSKGNVYTVPFGPFGALFRIDASQFGGNASWTQLSQKGVAVAADPTNDDIYVDDGSEIDVFDSNGAFRETIKPFEEPAAFGGSRSIVLNGATHSIYVTDDTDHEVNVFGPLVAVPDPVTGTPDLTTTSATFKGTVNPQGMETDCFFEYGTDFSYGQTAPCSSKAGSGSAPVEVSAEAAGLQPNTVYHVRLTAESANGRNRGEDVTFVLPFPPAVGREWTTDVAVSAAVVNVSISSMSYQTTYHVEYGADTNYGSISPVPDAGAGSGQEAKIVVSHLTGLRAATTYHYRVVATNANGVAVGADRTFTTFEAPLGEAPDACSNTIRRTGFSADLPDCRVYEMVSPIEKNGSDVSAQSYKEFAASESGESVQYPTRTGMDSTLGSGFGGYSQFIANRSEDGWISKGITPAPALNAPLQFGPSSTQVLAFSDDFSRGVVLGYELPGGGGLPAETRNLYLEDTSNGSLLDRVSRFEDFEEPIGNNFTWEPELGGSSGDLEVVTFQLRANLVAQASGQAPKVYALEHGTVKLAGILPDGSVPAEGSALVRKEKGAIGHKDTVSRDGSRIFFMSPAEGSERQLYLRKNGSSSVLVSQSEASEQLTAQNVSFQAANASGTKVVFTTTTRLLDADPGGSGTAFYIYTDSPNPGGESNLTFIARAPGEGVPQEDIAVKGLSEDGSHVYFLSGALEPQGPEGFFLWDSGQIRHVAPSAGGRISSEDAIVSSDGHRIAFMSREPATGADIVSLDNIEGETDTEMYVYDEDSDTLKCVSCPPTGASITKGIERLVRATSYSNPGFAVSALPRFFTQNGRYAFFNTKEALVAQDTNSITDAYEYDADTGKLSLLSTGDSENGTWFVDASADGRDVFLVTRQALSRSDPDKLVDLYDARIGGGLPEPPIPGTPCAGDACQGIPSAAPSFNTASEFSGVGNPIFQPTEKVKPRSLSRAQRLRRALVACHGKRVKRKRIACEALARKRYAVKKPARRAARTGR